MIRHPQPMMGRQCAPSSEYIIPGGRESPLIALQADPGSHSENIYRKPEFFCIPYAMPSQYCDNFFASFLNGHYDDNTDSEYVDVNEDSDYTDDGEDSIHTDVEDSNHTKSTNMLLRAMSKDT